jgi:hypothetical protein
MRLKQFFNHMIKIPAFIIGGLLILTGIAGYLLQDPGLSIKITGPLAEDAQLTLSDGNQSHELDLGFASSDAAGEHAYWLIYNLNLNQAKDASQGNYAIDQGANDRGYVKKSFWYASSKGETMTALMQESDNFQGAGDGGQVEIDWANVDQNASKVRLVFKDFGTSPGPITLQANNWQNIDISPKPKPNQKIEFGTSWTAFIPGLLGIILILLTLAADKFPKSHKHFMHAAVLVALVCFFVVTKMLLKAYSEMSWLKEEPFMIIHVSSLKPTTMLLSAGLLLIFVILCIVSFIEARKNRIAEEKKAPKKSIISPKKPASKDSDSGDKKDSSSGSEKSKGKSSGSNKTKDAPSKDTDSGDKKDSPSGSEKSKVKSSGSNKPKDALSKDSDSRDKKDSPSGSEKSKEKSSDSNKTKDAINTSKTDTLSVSPKPVSTADTEKKSPILEKKRSAKNDQSNESNPKSPVDKTTESKPSMKPVPPTDTATSEKVKKEPNSTIPKVAPISKPENSKKEAEVKKDETDSSNKE